MTQILISQVRITSSQIIVKVNNTDRYFELFDFAQILKHIKEKQITIISREYHKHNDFESFRNNFMLKIYDLLDNTNFKQFPEKYTYKDKETDYCQKQNYRFNYPHWLIDSLRFTGKIYIVTIRNIMNEKLEDD